MEYHLDRKIRLENSTENTSLYPWCIQELDDEGNQIGTDLIPWEWSFYFTASELRLNQGLEYGELSLFKEQGSEENKEFKDTEIITATLHPGICVDGKWLEDDPDFSMFGTDRIISEFTLRIYKDDENEHCQITGGVSYTSEVDFRDETNADFIEIYLAVSEERFNRLSELISNKKVDIARVSLSNISGFYSEWSPSISTRRVKVLSRGSEHDPEKIEGCDIEPPRLGDVGKFDLNLTTRCKLNPKQDLSTLNISKVFVDDIDLYENEIEEVPEKPEDVTNLLLAKIVQNQSEIARLGRPLWLLVFLSGLLLITFWF